MRVFISSTEGDLAAHRKAVGDAVRRRGWEIEAMEHWGADARRNLALCCDRVANADVVVALVAHRYGSPVPLVEGGDGLHSYTWYELEAADALGRPVFGYLMDERVGRIHPQEEGPLPDGAQDATAVVVVRRISLLEELKTRLRRRGTGVFTEPDGLAGGVVADISRWADEQAAAPSSATLTRKWLPHLAHALEPASRFAGRTRELAELTRWWEDTAAPDRLVALVAPGGTGKTAVVEHLLAVAPPPAAGLFVWSFYEAPEVDHFLQAAAGYFGRRPVAPGGALEALKTALRGEAPHLLVLDGLERVQAEGESGGLRGQIEDPALRQLVRLLAAGSLGKPRALVTTRFPMRDLDNWRGRGYRAIELVDLDPAAARAVLAGWGVRGDVATLEGLATRVGRHALSVSVLGSYLGDLCHGDPSCADSLDLEVAAGHDLASARLGRLLVYYRELLRPDECQIMGWLAAFSRGVEATLLRVLTHAGGEVAGVLVDASDAQLSSLLERLCGLGLVFRAQETGALRWSAHPFLRDHFRVLVAVPRPALFDVVRAEMGHGLESQPGTKPTDAATLDRYEALLEATREAGRTKEAFDLYWHVLGGYAHLGKARGDYVRGRRILEGFADGLDPRSAGAGLTQLERARLLTGWGLFRWALGDLDGGRACLLHAASIRGDLGQPANEAICLRNAAVTLIDQGQLCAARVAAERALALDKTAGSKSGCKDSTAYLATIDGMSGDLASALARFERATQLEGGALSGAWSVREAELMLALGNMAGAHTRTEANLSRCKQRGWGRDVALCHDLLGRIDPSAAQPHLHALRAWAAQSDEVWTILATHRLAALHALVGGDPVTALGEAEEGIAIADALGYGLRAIDLRVAAAQAALVLIQPERALNLAQQAYDRAIDPICGYAWGEADAAHLCGLAHRALGEAEAARSRFEAALAVRRRIRHPGVSDTLKAMKV